MHPATPHPPQDPSRQKIAHIVEDFRTSLLRISKRFKELLKLADQYDSDKKLESIRKKLRS